MDRKFLTDEQLIDMLDGMNSDLELSDEEDNVSNELIEFSEMDDNQEVQNDFDDFDEVSNFELNLNEPEILININLNNINKPFTIILKKSIKWMCKPLKQKVINLRELEPVVYPSEIPSPIEYFMRYFTEEAFTEMATYTNIYAVQQNTSNWINTTASEMKIFVGIHTMMGILSFPRARMYWEHEFRINIIADSMSRNRFFELRTHFHVINNEEVSPTNTDKFIKVRPLFDYLKNRFYQLPIERNISIDEQMVPFKGKLACKQYMRGKPNPWGIKMFLMCGSSGIVYDFIMFQGKSTGLDINAQNVFGQGGAIVMQFAERLKQNTHFVYFDNYFTSYNLLSELADRKIFAAGTVRVSRFANPPLISDKVLSKIGRGTSFEVTGTSEGQRNEIGLIKWFDNKGVVVGSNLISSGNPEIIKRWDKKNKEFIHIERPEIIGLYNKSMGGVDVHDQLVSFYRIFIKSRKWTLRLVAHSFDMASVNSWLEYKRDALHHNTQRNDTADLLEFKERLAKTLITIGKTQTFTPTRKRGRPSNSPSPVPEPAAKRLKTKPRCVDSHPYIETITDGLNHMPTFDDKENSTRCKYGSCKFKTKVYCTKCNIHLCFLPGRECYRLKHKK